MTTFSVFNLLPSATPLPVLLDLKYSGGLLTLILLNILHCLDGLYKALSIGEGSPEKQKEMSGKVSHIRSISFYSISFYLFIFKALTVYPWLT